MGFRVRGCVLETMGGYLIGASLISVAINILAIFGHYRVIREQSHFAFLPAILFCLMVAIAEETVFRGYMLPAFERRWGTFTAVIVSSFIFGGLHILNVPHSSPALQCKITVFLALEAGLPLAGAYLATRKLWMPIGLHWAWNFFLGPIYGATVSGMNLLGTRRLAVLNGSPLMTGGSFGPEAGVALFVTGTIIGIGLLIVAARAGNWKLAPARHLD
jgi:membrane protease YdiL (CAAX protease family)